jgi:putative ABC transport system ATP-binding protein
MDGRPASAGWAVEATDLTRTLPLAGEQVHILNGVSFQIARGEWVALTGPSGSGKSTLLGIVAGLDTPTGGRIVIDGVDITRMDESALARIRNEKIGIVFQSFNLIPSLTAQENVEVPLYVRADHRRAPERAREMLELVGLGPRRRHRPHQLSGGEQQRVAIARALVTAPALLLADEPTGNLDSAKTHEIMQLLKSLNAQRGLTIVLVTHEEEVAAYARRKVRFRDGHIESDTGYKP